MGGRCGVRAATLGKSGTVDEREAYDKQDSEDSKYWSSRFPCWVLLALSRKKQMKSTDKLSWPVN